MSYSAMNASLEYKLIRDIVKEYPRMTKIMQRYFGGHCLERSGFKIQTLGMACILFGVDQKRLLKELKDLRN
ncbi:MAG: hypothetical protein QME90_12840 [Thermodesulfobacteriota bacterium]|nr:hypothetical protein [Thermodesulfobacteriota bacterium]